MRRHSLITAAMLCLIACGSDKNADAPPQAPQPYPAPQSYPAPSPTPPYLGQPYPQAPNGHGNTGGDRAPQNPQEAQAELARVERELDMVLRTPTADALSSRCARLCASLGSMRRAVESLCRLTGEGDARCVSARNRLQISAQRVTQAGCAC